MSEKHISVEEDKDFYDATANNPISWRENAHSLHLASKTLLEKLGVLKPLKLDNVNDVCNLVKTINDCGKGFLGLGPVALMLLGYSIEAYLKAFWLTQGNLLAREGRLSPLRQDNQEIPAMTKEVGATGSIWAKHNLRAMAKEVDFSLSSDEQEILEILSLYATSYGRYPVTMKYGQSPLRDNKIPMRVRELVEKDYEVAEAMINRLEQAVSAGIPSLGVNSDPGPVKNVVTA